jgi:WD40 repeat protein
MNYVLKFAEAIALGVWLSQPHAGVKVEPNKIISVEGVDFHRTPPAMVCGVHGEFYIAYRDRGINNLSSSVWVVAFDMDNGRELKRVQFKAPTTNLLRPMSTAALSSDGSVLLYAERSGSHFLATVETSAMKLISIKELQPLDKPDYYPSPEGFDSDGKSIILASSSNDGGIEITKLDARNLSRELKKKTVPRPEGRMTAVMIDGAGDVWFSDGKFIYDTLTQYDLESGKPRRKISTGSHIGFGLGYVLFLRSGAVLGFTSELDAGEVPFGRIFLYDQKSESPVNSGRIEGCGFNSEFTSSFTPDQRFAIAYCERKSQAERSFGATVVSNLVVIDTQNLQVKAQIPTDGKWTTMNIGHSGTKIVVAIANNTNRIKIYSFADH